MEQPNFNEIGKRLSELSQNCIENGRLGERNLILAIAEMISVSAWLGLQQKDMVEEMRILNANLIKLDTNSSRASEKLIWLTWGLFILTIGLLVLTVVLLLKS